MRPQINNHFETLKAIKAFARIKKYMPSRNELSVLVGKARATIDRHLLVLEAEGYITREIGKTRGIRLTGLEPTVVEPVSVVEVEGGEKRVHKMQVRGKAKGEAVVKITASPEQIQKNIERIVERNQWGNGGVDAFHYRKLALHGSLKASKF